MQDMVLPVKGHPLASAFSLPIRPGRMPLELDDFPVLTQNIEAVIPAGTSCALGESDILLGFNPLHRAAIPAEQDRQEPAGKFAFSLMCPDPAAIDRPVSLIIEGVRCDLNHLLAQGSRIRRCRRTALNPARL